ncbi:MAG TPA: LysR family transcriptional regulator [Candidatus Acidoferrum sp.]|nr:LysR family transcriptional regulator [Candidatus Acidoferrum sp.]
MRLEHAELKTFQAVVEANGFNRAAERLHVTQSAVSQTIANLEAKLGAALIKRGRQLKLTDAGRRLLDHANAMLQQEQQTLEDIAQLKRGERHTLNLAINSTITRFHAPQLLRRFAKSHADTLIKVTELPSRNLIYAVLSGQADLAIGPFQKYMDAFTTVPLYRENRHLVISPRHPLFDEVRKAPAKHLHHCTLITSFLDTPEARPSQQRIRDRFQAVWEVSSLSLRIHLVEQGLGVSFISRRLLDEEPLCAKLVVLEGLPFSTIERQVGLYYQSGRHLNPAHEQLIALCRQFWKKG